MPTVCLCVCILKNTDCIKHSLQQCMELWNKLKKKKNRTKGSNTVSLKICGIVKCTSLVIPTVMSRENN